MSSDSARRRSPTAAARDRRRARRVRRGPGLRRRSRSPAAATQLIPVAVHKLGVEDIEALLRKRMLEADVRVIFTDLQAGSCTMASRRILRGMDDAVLIAGTNLPTLLDFVFAEGSHGAARPRGTRRSADARRSPCTGRGA